MRMSRWLMGCLIGGLAFVAVPAIAAVDAYLQIDGVKGESQTRPGWIEVSSFHWGVGRGISSPTGGSSDRESSAPSVSEIVITKVIDKASPMLRQANMAGRHLGTVTLMMRKAGGEQMLRYVLSDVMISSYSLGSGGDRPTESLTLSFRKIEVEGRSPASDRAVSSESMAKRP
jgi:type VI secretion system secreted protein Hcp